MQAAFGDICRGRADTGNGQHDEAIAAAVPCKTADLGDHGGKDRIGQPPYDPEYDVVRKEEKAGVVDGH